MPRAATRRFAPLLSLALGACGLAAQPGASVAPLARLHLPPGFAIAEYARVPGARSLLVAEDGAKVYVATRDSRVFAILDPERDGSANEVVTVASGLKVPNGLALAPDGVLLIAEQHRVIRLDAGGRATIDGKKGESLENARVGVTVALPINRYNSVKLYGSTGVYAKTGGSFDIVGIAWQLRWGGGL